MSDAWLDEVAFDADGLIPVLAQEAGTGKLLMIATPCLKQYARGARYTGHARAGACGARARNRVTCSGSRSSGWIAMPTRW